MHLQFFNFAAGQVFSVVHVVHIVLSNVCGF